MLKARTYLQVDICRSLGESGDRHQQRTDRKPSRLKTEDSGVVKVPRDRHEHRTGRKPGRIKTEDSGAVKVKCRETDMSKRQTGTQ